MYSLKRLSEINGVSLKGNITPPHMAADAYLSLNPMLGRFRTINLDSELESHAF